MGKQGSEKVVRFGILPQLVELFKTSGFDIQREVGAIAVRLLAFTHPS
jgi:hypothetical protein